MKENLKFLFAVFILFVIVGCGLCGKTDMESGSDEKSNETSNPEVTVSASQLFSDYQANEVSADNKYKGKILSVSGTVEEIRKDFMDDIIVDLQTSNQFMSVSCEMKSSQSGTAANLSKGEQVTIVGKCTGMIIGSPQLEDCVIK